MFDSAATDLVAGDDNGHVDVFQAPAAGGPATRLTDGNGASTDPATSGDGSIVAFSSVATDLVAGDTNGAVADVFVRTATPGDDPTLERIGGPGPSLDPDLSADGGTVVFEGDDLIVEMPGPQAYLAPLPLGPDPTFVRLSDGFSGRGPTVAADGSRAIFVEFEPVSSSYQSTVVLVDLAESGAVLDRVDVPSGYKPQSARLAGGSGHLLVMAFWEGLGIGDKMLGLGRPTLSGLFPASSDLTADGRFVVGSLDGQLRLYGTP